MDSKKLNEFLKNMSRCEQYLGECGELLGSVLKAGASAEEMDFEEEMSPLDAAMMYHTLGELVIGLCSLAYACEGIDASSTQLVKEKTRLEAYHKKINKAISAKELQNSKKTLELDISAANRFISAAIPHLSNDEKAKLRNNSEHADKVTPRKGAKSKKTKRDDTSSAALHFLNDMKKDMYSTGTDTR
eukprot:jgi/Picsp_1/2831/NSC_01057-R1_sas10 utp3 c1d family protein